MTNHQYDIHTLVDIGCKGLWIVLAEMTEELAEGGEVGFGVEEVGVGECGLEGLGGDEVIAFEALLDEAYPLCRDLIGRDVHQLLQLHIIHLLMRLQLLIQIPIQFAIGQ